MWPSSFVLTSIHIRVITILVYRDPPSAPRSINLILDPSHLPSLHNPLPSRPIPIPTKPSHHSRKQSTGVAQTLWHHPGALKSFLPNVFTTFWHLLSSPYPAACISRLKCSVLNSPNHHFMSVQPPGPIKIKSDLHGRGEERKLGVLEGG